MKSLTAACCIILLSISSYAQTPDTSTVQKLLQYIFQPIDKSQVPTGFLGEYGCPILPMETFNGTLTDSNRIDMNLWRTLYLQLQTGYCQAGTNPLPAITDVNTVIKQNIGSALPTPIPILIGQYNTVRSDAFTGNLLSYNSSTNQVQDVPGRPQSPYLHNNLFAACPNYKQTTRGAETFICPANLIWNNTGKTITALQIDFANGLGFQNITIGSPVSVSYSNTGYKRWTIKVTLSDNSILQCYNEYYVLKASNAARYEGRAIVTPAWGFIFPVGGVHAGGDIRIVYSNRNPTNTLRKPLIVVEGYDVSTIAQSIQAPPGYTIDDFLSDEDGINEFKTTYDFDGQLDDVAGYDLVFINFGDGADDIRHNALVVQEAINRVNANKVLDDRFGNIRQQNVVMGLSMGGLVARYALAQMTKAAVNTETRLLITHDSPHRGANVPLGMQYLIRMMGGFQLFGYNVYDIYPDYDDAIRLLNAPATEQMLIYRSTSANSFVNNTFLDGDYRTMITFAPTDPQPTYRFIATSQGNECAHPLFNPGSTFINLGAGVSAGIDARILFFRVPIVRYRLAAEVEAYALPNTGSTAKIARLFTINQLTLFGFINVFRQLYNNTAFAPGNHLAVDGVPGSNYPLLDVEALNEITNLPAFNPVSLYVIFPLGPFFSGYFGVYAYNAGVSLNWTFVSVGSALDVAVLSGSFTQNYVNGVNQNFPSRAETFIAQESVPAQSLFNNLHIRFAPRTSQWLYNEMENLPNQLNCSNECSNSFYIAGIPRFCASGSYSIPGLQRGVAVTWTATPNGIVNIATNNNVATLTKLLDGRITLQANFTTCGSAKVFTLPIDVGNPTNVPLTIHYFNSGGGPLCRNFAHSFEVVANGPALNLQGITGIQWRVVALPGPEDIITYNAGSYYSPGTGYVNGTAVTIKFPSSPSTPTSSGTVQINLQNACGWTAGDEGDGLWITPTNGNITVSNQSCPGFFTMAPNPADNAVTIQQKQKDITLESGANAITQVTIYDVTGILKKQVRYGTGVQQVRLSVADLGTGIYFIEIMKGKAKERQPLLIRR